MKINKKIIITILMTLLTASVSEDYDILIYAFTVIIYYGMCLSGEYVYQSIKKLYSTLIIKDKVIEAS